MPTSFAGLTLAFLATTGLVYGSAIGEAHAQDRPISEYEVKLGQSRAKRGYDCQGTCLYLAPTVKEYDDSLSGAELGNVHIDRRSNIRRIYSYTTVEDNILSEKADLHIGVVTTDRVHMRDVRSSVTVEGNIRGRSLTIGGVNAVDGSIDNLKVDVEVQGSIRAD